jgi:prepilin-type N-terminal cleavage/methylation domain-containing protein
MTPDRHDNDAGFTLVELLIGMTMSLVIVMAAVAMFTSTLHTQPKETATADVLGTARNAVEKMTTDLREGEKATLATPSSLVLTTPCTESNEVSCEIRYQCAQEVGLSTFDCTRTAEGTTTTTVKGLANGEVFCVFPTSSAGKECGLESTNPELASVEREPRYVGITLEFPNHKEAAGTTVLEDGAALHNRGLEGLVPQ